MCVSVLASMGCYKWIYARDALQIHIFNRKKHNATTKIHWTCFFYGGQRPRGKRLLRLRTKRLVNSKLGLYYGFVKCSHAISLFNNTPFDNSWQIVVLSWQCYTKYYAIPFLCHFDLFRRREPKLELRRKQKNYSIYSKSLVFWTENSNSLETKSPLIDTVMKTFYQIVGNSQSSGWNSETWTSCLFTFESIEVWMALINVYLDWHWHFGNWKKIENPLRRCRQITGRKNRQTCVVKKQNSSINPLWCWPTGMSVLQPASFSKVMSVQQAFAIRVGESVSVNVLQIISCQQRILWWNCWIRRKQKPMCRRNGFGLILPVTVSEKQRPYRGRVPRERERWRNKENNRKENSETMKPICFISIKITTDIHASTTTMPNLCRLFFMRLFRFAYRCGTITPWNCRQCLLMDTNNLAAEWGCCCKDQNMKFANM